jgi:hypothetical protein
MTTYKPDGTSIPDTSTSVKTAASSERAHAAATCAAAQRHSQRSAHLSRGMLDPASPVVAARLCNEGVPQSEVRAVAADLLRVLPLVRTSGVDIAYVHLHPWAAELVDRYRDKVAVLFLTTRGKVSRQ